MGNKKEMKHAGIFAGSKIVIALVLHLIISNAYSSSTINPKQWALIPANEGGVIRLYRRLKI